MTRRTKEWVWRMPSDTCQVREGGRMCGSIASVAYPAMGSGYMALCPGHGQKHSAYTVPISAARHGAVPIVEAVFPADGEWIEMRRAAGYSLEEAAAAAGIGVQTLRAYERGNPPMTTRAAERLRVLYATRAFRAPPAQDAHE